MSTTKQGRRRKVLAKTIAKARTMEDVVAAHNKNKRREKQIEQLKQKIVGTSTKQKAEPKAKPQAQDNKSKKKKKEK